MKVFLIDAYDSFVFIISQYLEQLGLETRVARNDVSDLANRITSYNPDFVVLGPGPGHPSDAGYVDIIRRFQGHFPMLGVCLGHQAIGLAFGGRVSCAENVMHGKVSVIHNDGRGVYSHTDAQPIKGTRYHSLIVEKKGLPRCFEATSYSEGDGYLMGIRHRTLPVEGVQFHPESILTDNGIRLFQSFIDSHCVKASAGGRTPKAAD